MVTYMKRLWSNACICVFMLLFSFSILVTGSIFSDRLSLKIENANNSMKTLTAEVSYVGWGP